MVLLSAALNGVGVDDRYCQMDTIQLSFSRLRKNIMRSVRCRNKSHAYQRETIMLQSLVGVILCLGRYQTVLRPVILRQGYSANKGLHHMLRYFETLTTVPPWNKRQTTIKHEESARGLHLLPWVRVWRKVDLEPFLLFSLGWPCSLTVNIVHTCCSYSLGKKCTTQVLYSN